MPGQRIVTDQSSASESRSHFEIGTVIEVSVLAPERGTQVAGNSFGC
jgi:hypothetical protein